MKRLFKVMLLSAVVTTFLAIPAFAQEVTDPNTVIKEEVLVAELDAHHNAVISQLKNYEADRAENYVKYLDGVIYNLNETVRIKKEVVTNYTWLAQYNPYYASLVPAAQADLNQAEAWVQYYTLYRDAAKTDLSVRYPR